MAEGLKHSDLVTKHSDLMELYKQFNEEWKDRYALGAEDVLFSSGVGQWPDSIKAQRESDDRPCLTINKMEKFVKSVSGDQKQNRPSAKVYPVDSKGDPAIAEVLQDMIRHIEYKSTAEAVYDTGFVQCLRGSIGFWRILSEYEGPDTFDQGLRIRKILNPFSVLMDPYAKNPNYTDARACFIIDRMPRKEFDEKHKKEPPANFDADESFIEEHGWFKDDYVRLAECYYFEKKTKKLALLNDGQIVTLEGEVTKEFLEEQGFEIVDERESEEDVLYWCKISGSGIIEGPEKQAGKFIPVVCVPGDEVNVQGRPMMFSLIRHAKDSQRMYNYFHSASVETQALQPQAPFLLTSKQLGPHRKMWREYPRRKQTYLLYDYDPLAGKPDRLPPPTTNTGAFSEMAKLDEELYDTIGMSPPSLGLPSNERSGKALILRQRASDKAIFTFFDNHARAVAHTARILIDLIPHYYNNERIIRVMGDDGKLRETIINSMQQNPQTGDYEIVNDLSDAGEYDVIAKSGPSYETKRQEAADAMGQLVQYAPNFAPIIVPFLAKNLDAPGMAEIAEAMMAMLPPQVQALIGGGTPSPENNPATAGQMGLPVPEEAPSPMG